VSGPFVMIWTSLPLRKAMTQDATGILRFAPAPLEAERFHTAELAQGAIDRTEAYGAGRGYAAETYEVMPLVTWEDEQDAQTRRERERADRAKKKTSQKLTTGEGEG
jgi:hypothetical protein